jgi:tetratricopeptide (TPR) repeat protein
MLSVKHRAFHKDAVLFVLLALVMASTACAWVTARLFPGQATEHFSDGVAAASQGDYEPAIASFTQAIQLDPTNAEANYARAKAYFVLGSFEQAVADFSSAIELDYQPLSHAYAARGDANTVLGSYHQSREDYNHAFSEDSGFVDAYAQGRVRAFSRALELDPHLASGYYARGWAYYWLGESQAAIADCTQAIALGFDPLSRAYAACGLARSATGDHEQAIMDFTTAIEIDPHAADIYFARGNAHIGRRNHAQAVGDFRAAIELDRDFALAHNNLCWYASLLGEAAEVMESCERAVLLEPNVPAFRDSRGLARALIGDFAGAIEDFRYYVEASEAGGYYETGGAQRDAWIDALEAGRNPFDEAMMEELLDQ